MSEVIDLTAIEDPIELVDLSSDDEDNTFAGFGQESIEIDLISSDDDDDEEEEDEEDEGDELILVENSQRARYGHIECAHGQIVEFTDGTFMKIRSVIRATDITVVLEGMVFKQQNVFGLSGHLPATELVYVRDLTRKVHPWQIAQNRVLILTNYIYPSIPEQYSADPQSEVCVDPKLDILFCRWKVEELYLNKRLIGQNWLALNEAEADPSARIADKIKRNRFRKVSTIRGGSHVEDQICWDMDNCGHLTQIRQYTFGDAFCGAGGASMGASSAGLNLQWSFDCDKDAINTYQLNFPTVESHILEAHCFLQMVDKVTNTFMVDILHISPPCQPFSPAHTTSWTPESIRRDEQNEAALFAVPELIRTIKPRIVTVEETEGLVNRHKEWFERLLHFFVDAAYSVRWKIVKCVDYGVPQITRHRLVIIAAGPGETLPDFPAPTHSPHPTGNMTRTPTIHECIKDLIFGVNNHIAPEKPPNPQPPFSEHSYAATVTCNSGVGNYHPSGLRHYTTRELACLQTFPRTFQFAPSDDGHSMITKHKRQVGNAVPPLLGKAIFKNIIKSLKQTDLAG